ncbi:pyrroloquinoline quinone biosynthesis protein PqqB [Spirillospora sp. CA-294931]|uniref:pyrroloquinoline quinone biosynthesis protein PqqB n=1 Tax=Spirillospora sp. CA-294931 TaxID=3240042 RepID=UPI003D8D3358
MELRILGTAAGGGVPQWNCACAGCAGARRFPERRRRHASLAVRAAPGRWYIVNATPDIGEQIEAEPDLWPGPERRATPLAGVILTDAELDHTLGIARLREADAVDVCATPAVRSALRDRLALGHTLRPYTDLTWTDLPEGGAVRLGTIEAEGIRVSSKRPRYAADDPPDGGWVVALRLTDLETGGTAVYAPALGTWPENLRDAVADAACVIIDGTFWDDQEPRTTGISARTATEMGHLPIHGPEGTAESLAKVPGRVLYTHLNNTNPLVDPGAPQHRALAELGLEVAQEGSVITL